MAEDSYPWSDGAGDGGPYTHDQIARYQAALASADGDNVGVVGGFQESLEPSASGVDQVSINTGRAFVNGHYYENDAMKAINLTRPSIGPTGCRLVLQKDWTGNGQTGERTVRAVVISNTDGDADLPDLTQDDQDIWEIPIASFVHDSADGSIDSFVDEREFTRPAYVNFPINGLGAVITTGERPSIGIPQMVITGYALWSSDGNVGDLKIDIAAVDGFATEPEFPGDSIVGLSEKPELSGSDYVTDSNLTGWARKNLNACRIKINVEEVATIEQANLLLFGYRS